MSRPSSRIPIRYSTGCDVCSLYAGATQRSDEETWNSCIRRTTRLAFVRRHEEERLLVVANLSRFVQSVELDLRPYRTCARRAVRANTV